MTVFKGQSRSSGAGRPGSDLECAARRAEPVGPQLHFGDPRESHAPQKPPDPRGRDGTGPHCPSAARPCLPGGCGGGASSQPRKCQDPRPLLHLKWGYFALF